MAQNAKPMAKDAMADDQEGLEREPFAAYLTDDASQVAAQVLAAQRGWSASTIRKGGLGAALRLLGIAPPPRFMIVDVEGLAIEEVEAGLTELARLGSSVMALGTVNDVDYFRRIMRAGARDYLIKPVGADALGEQFVRLEQPGDGGKPLGRVVGTLGARGGVGVTTVAINTAWIMAEKLRRKTALVDMDLYSGTIALALDLEPTRGLREVFEDPERVDEHFLQNAMEKATRHLHVLGTEEAYDDTVPMTDQKVLMIVDCLRANFDMLILDLPRHFAIREPALFSRCDEIVIVAELTLQSLRDANRLARLMLSRNRQARLHIVANRVTKRPDITAKEFEAGIEGKLRASFAFDAKAMARTSLKGRPLAATEPKHRMVSDLHGLCIELAGVPEEVKTGFFWRRRKA